MKIRLDMVVLQRGLAASRNAAAAMIMAGEISSREKVLVKPGMPVDSAIELAVKTRSRFVSRGGDKLASVAEQLHLECSGTIVLDVGSSTGGFTDFALQHGAKKVYAVDVGTAQLAYRLRQNPQVVVMERTDMRGVESLPEPINLALIDVSFISLTKVLPAVVNHLAPDGIIVAMAKPQFEAGKAVADKFRGMIKDEAVRLEVLDQFRKRLEPDFKVFDEVDSHITGAKGNRERFYLLQPRR